MAKLDIQKAENFIKGYIGNIKTSDHVKHCVATLFNYPKVMDYFDLYTVCCMIPFQDLFASEEIRKELLSLLKEPCLPDIEGRPTNWGMEYIEEEGIDKLCVRPVISWS